LKKNKIFLFREFLDSLFKRLNERLKEVGHLSVRNLTKSWDLPMEILNEFVLPELGRKVEATKDEDPFTFCQKIMEFLEVSSKVK
jgi:hypothetical protein